MVVVNNVDVDNVVDGSDGSCVGIVSDDMADSGGDRGLGVVLLKGAVCVMASREVVEVV
jgi:hypothetical protein